VVLVGATVVEVVVVGSVTVVLGLVVDVGAEVVEVDSAVTSDPSPRFDSTSQTVKRIRTATAPPIIQFRFVNAHPPRHQNSNRSHGIFSQEFYFGVDNFSLTTTLAEDILHAVVADLVAQWAREGLQLMTL
jgi:hypothetical protein